MSDEWDEKELDALLTEILTQISSSPPDVIRAKVARLRRIASARIAVEAIVATYLGANAQGLDDMVEEIMAVFDE